MGHFPQQTRKKNWKVPETVSLTVWPCASTSENYCLTEIPGAGSRPEKNNPWTVPIDVVIAWIMMEWEPSLFRIPGSMGLVSGRELAGRKRSDSAHPLMKIAKM